MRIIEQSAEILDWSGLDLYQRVETAARVCRRSESKGDAEEFVRRLIKRGHLSPLEFARIETGGINAGTGRTDSENVRRVRERAADNNAWMVVLQQRLKAFCPALVEDVDTYPDRTTCIIPSDDWIPVLFVTSRTISHQLVRYRHDITFMQESQRHVRYDKTGLDVIEPPGLNDEQHEIWRLATRYAEDCYISMMDHKATAEQARAVLPGCTATRILAYASPEEWRHIFSQRCDKHADPQTRALMVPLRDEMRARGLV